jgi:sporulation protein YlmC with PRC-barrel domain
MKDPRVKRYLLKGMTNIDVPYDRINKINNDR